MRPSRRPQHEGLSRNRNGMIALIHVAKKQLALNDDAYRALLWGVCEKDSLREMNDQELNAVIRRFKKLGFVKKRPARRGDLNRADAAKTIVMRRATAPQEPQVAKIRALWLNLYHLGHILDSSEEALEAFVKRQSGIDNIHWLTSEDADKVIRGLRGWMTRTGYAPPTKSQTRQLIAARINRFGQEEDINYEGWANKLFLIAYQCNLLKRDLFNWMPLAGYTPIKFLTELGEETADCIIADLGADIRALKTDD